MAAQATGVEYGPVSLPLKDSPKDKGFHQVLKRMRAHIRCPVGIIPSLGYH